MKLLLTGLSFAALLVASCQGQLSPCNEARDQDSCARTMDEHEQPCYWCQAGAIPSECMSSEQAASLPSGVFDCSTPGSSFRFVSHLLGGRRVQDYTLKTKSVQPEVSDICDNSSKSLSGYIDIKGSEYDEKGENKHLFFWMFEKRGTIKADTPVRQSSCSLYPIRYDPTNPVPHTSSVVCCLAHGRAGLLQHLGSVIRKWSVQCQEGCFGNDHQPL
jgi:hypothetical protein